MTDEQQICGAVDEIDYGVWFECELLPGHAGDHQTLHTWQNEPHGPKLPPAPNRFLLPLWGDSLMTAYAAMINQQLEAAIHHSPFVNPDTAVRQAVNRDAV